MMQITPSEMQTFNRLEERLGLFSGSGMEFRYQPAKIATPYLIHLWHGCYMRTNNFLTHQATMSLALTAAEEKLLEWEGEG